jgi:hypothetical protein
MFLSLPLGLSVQHLVLVLNTVLLIGLLVVVELAYAGVPMERRRHLYYFLPIMIVIVGMVVYAMMRPDIG